MELRILLPVLLCLGPQHMSSDEAEEHDDFPYGPVYLIRQHPCLSEDLTALFRIVDRAYKTLVRRPSGSPGRHRVPSDLVMAVDSPPIGLPINCYNQAWLDTLTQAEKDALEATDPIDLTVAESLLR